MQTDPVKGASPWARGVVGSSQVLICSDCQARDSDWARSLDRCARCGSTRLSIVMGGAVCRECRFDHSPD